MEIFETKGLSEEKKKALEVAEAARETGWTKPSFVARLFDGALDWRLIHPYPVQSEEDRRVGDAFLEKLGAFLRDHLDPDEVDRTGLIPEKVYDGLAAMGCFAMKIPKEYGGLGLSQTNYNRAVALVASFCGSTAVLLSAHQSIGVPQPLLLFGTPEQKRKYLPRFAKARTISAFALTEIDVGSDPARMTTTATPVDNGEAYLINGQKLWCTNGPIADVLIVMAQTPPQVVRGKERKQITAFIVEKNMPGFEVVHRCRFMGLHGIQNGLVRFRDVKVPKENILWGLGQGLKLALITLNTGRLTVPAATTSMAKLCLKIVRGWAAERQQWGQEIGRHEAIASKIAAMAATTFAMESVSGLVSSMADEHKVDMRLEAAMSKLFCTEAAWRIADDTVQIRGGRGYETADSLRGRGETPIPAERILRDARINLIIEGTSEIMHLFIAREAMDKHLRLALPVLSPRTSFGGKLAAAVKAAAHYALWYPGLWLPAGVSADGVPAVLRGHLGFVARAGRRLGRNLFHAMAVYGPKLERRQQVLFRLVNIGTDLFAMAATIARAAHLAGKEPGAVTLGDLFCRLARGRIEREWSALWRNDDARVYAAGIEVLEGKHAWLEKGILDAAFGARKKEGAS
jgi:hypothetical protein